MQNNSKNKYKIELVYVQKGESRELSEECELLINENGRSRKHGASSIKIKAATNDILMEQIKMVIQAIEPGCDMQIIDTRRM